MNVWDGMYGGLLLLLAIIVVATVAGLVNWRLSLAAEREQTAKAQAKIKAIYDEARCAQHAAAIIRATTLADFAFAQHAQWARDLETRKRMENPYIRPWQGLDGEQPSDRYVHGGPGWTVRGVAPWKPEDYVESMKVSAEKLRKAGYTVTCTIKPPPATRKL